MVRVEYEYYQNEYMPGENEIPAEKWERYAKHAAIELHRLTFDRLRTKSEYPCAVKDCICAIAEALYISELTPVTGNGPLSSYSNDGESGSFDLSESMHTEKGREKKLREIARRHLANTGLLYAGYDWRDYA